MPSFSKVACILLAVMDLGVGWPNVFNSASQLRDVFGVRGDLSPIALHCCGIIGVQTIFHGVAFLWAASSVPSVRKAMHLCNIVSLPFSAFVQLNAPLNTPPPQLAKMEMPWPILAIQLGLSLFSLVLTEKAKPKGA